jgi:HEAT repeat protein
MILELFIGRLKSNDPDLRANAATSLGQIKDIRAVEPLIAAMDDFPYVTDSIIKALIKINAPAVEPLIAALRDENLNIRANAAFVLGEIKDMRAIAPLIASLEDESMEYCSGNALTQIGAPAVEPLIAALKDENNIVRANAASVLGRINDTRAIEPLIAVMKDEDPFVRIYVVSALGQIKDAHAISAVISALKDEDAWVVKEAEEILNQIKDVYAIEPLIEALKDEDENVRGWAYIALSQIGAPAVEPLIAALNDENINVRASAALLLGQIKDTRSVEPLLAAVKDESLDVRRAALYSLLGIEDARADEPIIAALKNEDLKFIAESYEFFIRKGVIDSEAVLIKVLEEYGSEKMAEDFLNCGNSLLVDAGTKWAQTHGYTITQVPGSGGPGWGSSSRP